MAMLYDRLQVPDVDQPVGKMGIPELAWLWPSETRPRR